MIELLLLTFLAGSLVGLLSGLALKPKPIKKVTLIRARLVDGHILQPDASRRVRREMRRAKRS